MVEVYKGNPNLKTAQVEHEYTAEQIEEFIKCSKDPVYFIQNYVQIVSIDEGLVPFDMYPFQKEIVGTFHKNRLPYVNCRDSLVSLRLLSLILSTM